MLDLIMQIVEKVEPENDIAAWYRSFKVISERRDLEDDASQLKIPTAADYGIDE